MRIFNIWNQFNLHWKKTSLIASLLILGTINYVNAQKRTLNLPRYDEKHIHYGFQIGLYRPSLSIKPSNYFLEQDSAIAIRSIDPTGQSSPVGFSVGFILNVALADELWSMRLLPNVAFYERSVGFYYPNSDPVKANKGKASTMLELPWMLKYKSVRRKNHRFYVTGGFVLGLEVGGSKNSDDEESLRFQPNNFEVAYGFGIDRYMQYFKFAPEIRFSHGIINFKKSVPNAFSESIQRMTTHKVALYLNFE